MFVYIFSFIVITIAVILYYKLGDSQSNQKKNQEIEDKIIQRDNLDYIDMKNRQFYEQDIFKQIHKLRKRNTLIRNYLHTNIIAQNEETNNRFFQTEKQKYGNIPALRKLNTQQQHAVFNKETNVLVNAGAGCGKSTTIIGKVMYLLESNQAKPDEILLISFTKDTVEDLNHKLESYGINSRIATTFHSLCSKIVKKEYKNISIAGENDTPFTRMFSSYQDELNSNELIKMFDYMAYYADSMESFATNMSGDDYVKYLESLTYETLAHKLGQKQKTLQGTKVKSLPEVIIANYLFSNGVRYEYEKPLFFNKTNSGTCKPDFFLPDYNVYIEHWGVHKDETGKEYVPWLRSDKEREYLKNKAKKLSSYKSEGIKLVNTYSYEFEDKSFISNLRRQLIALGVKLNPLTDTQKQIHAKKLIKYKKTDSLQSSINRFISLFKANDYYSDSDIKRIELETLLTLKSSFDVQRCKSFFGLFKDSFLYYQNSLQQENKLDFNDLISLATKLIDVGKIKLPYKYIIIDEYQDIAADLYKLVKSIKKQTSAKVFCVGDDWQSIYRFRGSDVNFFTKFEKYFECPKIYFIEETFRSAQNLVNVSSSFVQKNPAQLRKNIKSCNQDTAKMVAILYDSDSISAGLDTLMNNIVKDFGDVAEKDGILLLVRNWSDLDIFNKQEKWDKFGVNNGVSIKYKVYPNIKFNVKTIHGSKGLESEIVVILNMRDGHLGFPNPKTDDKLLVKLLVEPDKYLYAEERRLFYVALTRAKNGCYLFVPKDEESSFYWEIKDDFTNIDCSDKLNRLIPCPMCRGHLVVRYRADGSKFYGCSNYAKEYSRCTYTQNITPMKKHRIFQKKHKIGFI